MFRSRKPTSKSKEEAVPADVDVVTEYFLLGSLTSWLVALLFVPLLR